MRKTSSHLSKGPIGGTKENLELEKELRTDLRSMIYPVRLKGTPLDDVNVTLIELKGPNDPLLLPWLDLFETAFPPRERVLVSSILKLLSDQSSGLRRDAHLLTIIRKEQSPVGMAWYQVLGTPRVAYLWYLAILPSERSHSLGTKVYQKIIERLEPENVRALVFEVEIPEEAETAQESLLSRRRIAFYRRNGARLLHGIRYIQDIGWHQPPLPMHLMVHPFETMDAGMAFDLCKALFGEALVQTGPVSLD